MTWVIVPAAGRGARFGGEIPKQYVAVAGVPLVLHTLQALLSHNAISGVVVVLAADDTRWPGLKSLIGKPIVTCTGGESRADSVLAGLAALPASVGDGDFVLVHDAARPLLRPHDLDALLEQGAADPVGAILAAPVRDTLKRASSKGSIACTEPRDGLWRALTPQMFRRAQLVQALTAARDAGVCVTDEAMAMEHQGHKPLLVEGSDDNFKVTTAADLAMVEFVLGSR